MTNKSSLSLRGDQASNTSLRVDMEIYGEATENIFHPTENPDGALLLNMAENNLSWYLLKEKIASLVKENEIPDWVSNYTSSMGAPVFREALAGFISRFLTKRLINSNHLACSAGATPVVEVTSWILGNPGDVAVFPAPSYPVYKQDINNKAAIERYDLITHEDISEIIDGPNVRIPHLDAALADIESQGKRFRMLVLTNPDNPTGGMYSYKQLQKITKWCLAHNIHLIVNEIYGLSLIDTTHPEIAGDYTKAVDFISFAEIMQDEQSDYLHLWYSLSKDIGVSGFRVGAVYSLNEQFLQAYNNLNAPHMVSNYTQWIFQMVLGDHDFMADYIEKNQAALTASYAVVVKHLRSAGVAYAPSRGSLFVWIDLSGWLHTPTKEAETDLWLDIYKKTKVLITPADGFENAKRGQYRLVYTAISKHGLGIAMERLCGYLANEKVETLEV
ncbi:MAG: aspartate/methionine/tyrosine aminotransferase [Saprospiraceae bacterium]|jgi:aspartate/methionine/tyrosine aminotransferase